MITNTPHRLLDLTQLENSSKYNYSSYELEQMFNQPVSCNLGYLLFLYLHKDQYMQIREEGKYLNKSDF